MTSSLGEPCSRGREKRERKIQLHLKEYDEMMNTNIPEEGIPKRLFAKPVSLLPKFIIGLKA
jgi:hypothetical protein